MSSQLKRMYGFFRCPECHKEWESSHVYCPKGTFEASYGQQCKSCLIMCKPVRVENLICSQCGLEQCQCTLKERHVNPNKSHRTDLCGKCQSGQPCVYRGY